jgi:thioredoxin reductase (NADPH)
MLGGMAAEATSVENYPGFTQISGFELMEKMRTQAELCGVTLRTPETVSDMFLEGEEKTVKTDVDIYSTKALIIATGCTHRKLGILGEEEFRGRGVSYCATCDGRFFKSKHVMVVGGGNTAVHEALYLKELADKVYLTHRRDDLRADATLKRRILECGVEVLLNSEVQSIEGEDQVKLVRIRNNKTEEEKIVKVDGVFVSVGVLPRSEEAKKAGVSTDPTGFILANKKQETNIKGVYAAGNVTASVHQIGVAVGEGITAAVNAYLYVNRGWYGNQCEPARPTDR